MSRLLENLNSEQLKAVTLPRQSALILAEADSGKTRVLTTPIAYLIETPGEPLRALVSMMSAPIRPPMLSMTVPCPDGARV